jgi:hypothetical protein
MHNINTKNASCCSVPCQRSVCAMLIHSTVACAKCKCGRFDDDELLRSVLMA